MNINDEVLQQADTATDTLEDDPSGESTPQADATPESDVSADQEPEPETVPDFAEVPSVDDDDTPVDQALESEAVPVEAPPTNGAPAEAAPPEAIAPVEPPPESAPPDEEPEQDAEAIAEADRELFLAALSEEEDVAGGLDDEFMFKPLKRGDIIEGTIVRITESEILIDIGVKSEGIIAGRELERMDPEMFDSLEVGKEVTVYVLSPEDRRGNTLLSLTRAMEEQDWRRAEEYLESSEVYQGEVAGFNKGGLIVRFGKVRGFVPASQVSRERRRRSDGSTPEERWGEMLGEDISVKVIEVDRGRNRLILSERAAARETRAARRAKLMEELEVGQVRTGHVISLTDFGAFVDLGGADGLVHLSELSWKHVTHPGEVVSVGDEVDVEVISVDLERQRIGLSLKRCQPDPWDTIAPQYAAGQLVQGTVTKLTKFGAFARLLEHPEIEGLIHISELAEGRVEHPREVVSEGDVLTLRVVRVDPQRRRMGLSLKRVDSEDYLDADWHQATNGSADEEPADEEPVDEVPADEEPADEEPVDEVPADEVPTDEEAEDDSPSAEDLDSES